MIGPLGMFQMAADLVASLHLSFILFVAVGGALIVRWPALAWAHLPSVVWGVVFELAGFTCPLTRLENLLRQRAHLATYSGDFLEQVIHTIRHVTRPTQIALGLVALIGNGWWYARVFRLAPHEPSQPSS